MCIHSEIIFTVYPHLVQYDEKYLTASESSCSPKSGLLRFEERQGVVWSYF